MIRAWLQRLWGQPAPRPDVEATQSANLNETINDPWWSQATAGDADTATSPGQRDKLRRRARLETRNNAWLQGILQTLNNDLIGRGPRIQIRPEAESVLAQQSANRIELLWQQWAESQNLADKLKTLWWHKVVDGESFLVFESDATRAPTLNLAIYEPERFATPASLTPQLPAPRYLYDGIEYDGSDNPVVYYRLNYHPGSTYRYVYAPDLLYGYTEIPADLVVHLYRRDRASQHRGQTELESILDLCVDLRAYRDAAVAAARTAASISLCISTDMPPEDTATLGNEPFRTMPLPRDSIMNLPDGWEPTAIRAEQPTLTYPDFTKAIISELGRTFCMPYPVAAGSSEDMNYSSGRLDLQAYHRALGVDREYLGRVLLDRVFDAWLEETTLAGQLPRIGPFDHRWIWPGFAHVDPQKEADAAIALFNAGLLDERKYWSEQYGLAPDEAYEQMQRSIEQRRELGLPLPTSLMGSGLQSATEDSNVEETPA